MFAGATSFQGHISKWNVEQVVNMQGMFSAGSFKGGISSWDVGSVVDMSFMFADSALFNVDLSSWDLSSVDNLAYMFYRALSFDQDLCWDVSGKVTENMFVGSAGGSIKQGCTYIHPCDDDEAPMVSSVKQACDDGHVT
jgi:hypothetical protein